MELDAAAEGFDIDDKDVESIGTDKVGWKISAVVALKDDVGRLGTDTERLGEVLEEDSGDTEGLEEALEGNEGVAGIDPAGLKLEDDGWL